MKSIYNNERIVDTKCFHYIYNNELFESGHPLFNHNDSNIANELINKIINVVSILNDKLKNSPIKKCGYLELTDKKNEKKVNNRSYYVQEHKPISISINKLGFKDVINAKHSNLIVKICNIIDDISREDIDLFKTATSGYFLSSMTQTVEDGKFINIRKNNSSELIGITCFAINGNIILDTFLFVFLHEFQHFFDYYNLTVGGLHKTRKWHKYSDYFEKVKKYEGILFSKEECEALKLLLYRLFEDEDNALIGNLFGELISYNVSSLSEFKNVKEDMQVFKTYNNLKSSLNIVEDIDATMLHKFLSDNPGFFRGVKKMGNDLIRIDLDVSNKDANAIKRRFLGIVEKKLNKVYTKMMDFVGRYIYMRKSYEESMVTYTKKRVRK